jgi:hypothetical protein
LENDILEVHLMDSVTLPLRGLIPTAPGQTTKSICFLVSTVDLFHNIPWIPEFTGAQLPYVE